MRWFILNSDTKWRKITFFGWEGGVLRPVSNINRAVKSEAASFNVAAKNFTTASDVLSAVN